MSASRILLTGSAGFIGSALKAFLEHEGYVVISLKRERALFPSNTIYWNPLFKEWTLSDFEGFHAVINLAGEGIGDKRWTETRKKRLLSSRCETTELLSTILCHLSSPPKTLLSASAIGFYGSKSSEILTEEREKGEGFLASLCEQWEAAAKKVEKEGIRLVHLRFGCVLGKDGGILSKLSPIFRYGLGGTLGTGEQKISWISLYDLVRAISFCLKTPSLVGPVNFVAPHPLSQKEFARLLAKKFNRPAYFHIPAWLLHLFLGEMADELFLANQEGCPAKLLSSGFAFAHPQLQNALDWIYGTEQNSITQCP